MGLSQGSGSGTPDPHRPGSGSALDSPPRRRHTWAMIRSGYDRRSGLALALLCGTYSSIGYSYRDLVHPEEGMDWLLAAIWVTLSGLVVWRVRPSRDLVLLAVGLGGGAVIEWWGTNTELWRYFTLERPPLWILPAWPIAALAVDRLATLVHEWIPERGRRIVYWCVVPGFVVWMTEFLWPSRHSFASWVVVALMIGVTTWRPRPRWDVALMVAGTALGVLLEYWGTSRRCWTYYTYEMPPPVAVAAHGFASIAFARAVQLCEALSGRDLGQPIIARSAGDRIRS